MAPERIKGESQNNLGTYTVSSDVWSVGLSMIEIGMGHYPYPPETYSNVFAQLTAIVHGDPPNLPRGVYGEVAREWVGRCLVKSPEGRATYAELLVRGVFSSFFLSFFLRAGAVPIVFVFLAVGFTDVRVFAVPFVFTPQAHPFLVADAKREVDMVGWVHRALEHRRQSQSQQSASTLSGSVPSSTPSSSSSKESTLASSASASTPASSASASASTPTPSASASASASTPTPPQEDAPRRSV